MITFIARYRQGSSLTGLGFSVVALAAVVTFSAVPAWGQESLAVSGGRLEAVAPDASGLRVYKGIPYAQAPVGDLRWKAPQSLKPWDGVRSASEWGPRCMQSGRLGNLDPLNKRMDEDCLYLNVWSQGPKEAAQPVMVWIHGGSNTNGAGSQPEYDGAAFARRGVVLVTLNYRLDAFGFLAHPDLTAESGTKASGNYGLLDQIAALQWVQQNIASFGGDPKNVTVFGESAGAMDISLLMVSPLAKGLFAKAIGQSGGALTPVLPFGPKPLAVGEQEGRKLAQTLQAANLAELRAKPAPEILAALAKSPITYGFGVVDGHVVPDQPATLFATGKFNDVPFLGGFNADEGSLFTARMPMPADLQAYMGMLGGRFKMRSQQSLQHYPVADAEAQSIKAAVTTLTGDQIIGYGAWAWAEAAAAQGKSPVYRYHFTRRPPGAPEFSIYPLAAPGVYHFAEVQYVFNNLSVQKDWGWQDADRKLADAMTAYWVNFARQGDPNGAGLPVWPRYQAGGKGQVMELGATVSARDEPNRARYEFLDSVYRDAR